MAEMENNEKTINTLENIVKEIPNVKISEEEVQALLEVLEDDEENEERERQLKLEIITFLQNVFSDDKFIQTLIKVDQEKLLNFIERGLFYVQLDENSPDFIKDINRFDYSDWLNVFYSLYTLSENNLSYIRYIIVLGYKDYFEEQEKELGRLRKKLAMEKEDHKKMEEFLNYLSEEEKSISPSKELEKAVEESLKNIDINGDL